MITLKQSRLQSLIKSASALSKRKINISSVPQLLPLTTRILNQRPAQTLSSYCSRVSHSSNAQQDPHKESLDSATFESICEETLEHLTEYFEELLELDPTKRDADISYSSGVLTVCLGESGTYVINKQSPNKQIWLSSPTSGPKRFDFNTKEKYWVYSHTGESLHKILQEEMPKIFKTVENIDFSKCCYSKV